MNLGYVDDGLDINIHNPAAAQAYTMKIIQWNIISTCKFGKLNAPNCFIVTDNLFGYIENN